MRKIHLQEIVACVLAIRKLEIVKFVICLDIFYKYIGFNLTNYQDLFIFL